MSVKRNRNIIVLILFILFSYNLLFSQNRDENKIFIRVAEKNNLNPVIQDIENTIQGYYNSSNFPEITKENEKQILKTLVKWYNLPDEEQKEYFDVVKYEKQRFNQKNVKIVTVPQIIGRTTRKVEEECAWEWKFHLLNKYILIVKCNEAYPVEKNRMRFPFYSCDIIGDIKGNYIGDKKGVVFVGNFIKEKMEPGNTYMIFVLQKSTENGELQDIYMIRGLATDNHAIFPVENNEITDEFGVLNMGKKEITIEEYKAHILEFLNNLDK